MADRSRRVRRQISEITEDSSNDSESESVEEWPRKRSGDIRSAARYDSSASATPSMSRPKRTIGSGLVNQTSSATIHRSTSGSADDRRQSIRLTVKVPPSKLREVTRPNEVEALQDTLGGGKVLDGPRSRRALNPQRNSGRLAEKPRYTEYAESDIEDEEDEDEEDPEEDGEDEEEDDEEMNDFDQIGAEAEGGTDEEDEEDDEEDVEMDNVRPAKSQAPPRPPKITLKTPVKDDGKGPPKPRLIVTPAENGPFKSVEDQEMEDDPGDEEVEESSELSEDDGMTGNDEDAEGEDDLENDEDAEGEDDELDDDAEADSDDETPGSGTATPDLARLTKRQRGRPEDQGGLMALDMAPQQRKFFTDAEKAMKKDEHARKRKELTKRKTQEEKAAALNRLLKPQASKARGAVPKPETLAAAVAMGLQMDEEDFIEKAHPLYTRWISSKNGIKIAVPDDWLGKKVGRVFEPQFGAKNGLLVREVD